jgi:hypothetical protein
MRIAVKKADAGPISGEKPTLPLVVSTPARPRWLKLRILIAPAALLLGGILGYVYGSSVWFNAGTRLATKHLMQVRDLEIRLDEAYVSIRTSDAARERAERSMLKRVDVSKEDLKLRNVAENTVREIYGHLIEPMWLRDTYKVHRKADSWIVEGIVLEGRTDTAEACFWAVEIVSSIPGAAGLVPPEYEAKRVIFNLHLNERSSDGEWVEKGIIPVNTPHNYPRLIFD